MKAFLHRSSSTLNHLQAVSQLSTVKAHCSNCYTRIPTFIMMFCFRRMLSALKLGAQRGIVNWGQQHQVRRRPWCSARVGGTGGGRNQTELLIIIMEEVLWWEAENLVRAGARAGKNATFVSNYSVELTSEDIAVLEEPDTALSSTWKWDTETWISNSFLVWKAFRNLT